MAAQITKKLGALTWLSKGKWPVKECYLYLHEHVEKEMKGEHADPGSSEIRLMTDVTNQCNGK